MTRSPELKSLGTIDFLESMVKNLGNDLGLHQRDVENLVSRIRSRGYKPLTVELKKLGDAFLNGISTGEFQLPGQFKANRRGGKLPALLGTFFSQVFDKSGKYLGDKADSTAVYIIHSVTSLFKKIDLPYNSRKENKDAQVLDRFIQVDQEIGGWNEYFQEKSASADLEFHPFIHTAQSICAHVFSDYDSFQVVENFKHGPGSVSNLRSSSSKFEARIGPDLPLWDHFDIEDFFFNQNDFSHRAYRLPNADDSRSNQAKIILVNKDSRGPRLISAEPWENQYAQQGIAHYMVSKLESHQLTRGSVNFTDQTINGKMAEVASRTRQWSTLDLKDASDRISLELVKLLFRNTPLLNGLLAARTPSTRWEGADGVRTAFSLELNKYAPMGSALCFPVLASTIFLLIATHYQRNHGMTWDEINSSLFIYGDDVIVPTEYAHEIMQLLERFGLAINRDKSFVASDFAESCGTDSYKGDRITPIKLRVCPINPIAKKKLSPDLVASLLETANQMASDGWRASSRFLYRFLECSLGHPIPFGVARSPFLHRRTPPHLVPYVAELNFISHPQYWEPERNLDMNPLGRRLKAITLDVCEVEKPTSAYGHFQRIWKSIGNNEPLPDFGRFGVRRRTKLKFANYGWDSMSPVEPCSWLPMNMAENDGLTPSRDDGNDFPNYSLVLELM